LDPRRPRESDRPLTPLEFELLSLAKDDVFYLPELVGAARAVQPDASIEEAIGMARQGVVSLLSKGLIELVRYQEETRDYVPVRNGLSLLDGGGPRRPETATPLLGVHSTPVGKVLWRRISAE
jgi:hypothetical protein